MTDDERLCLVCGEPETVHNAVRVWRDADGEGHWIHHACMTDGHHRDEAYRRSFFGLTDEQYRNWLEDPR